MKPIAVIRHQETAPLAALEPVLEQSRLPWRYVDRWRGHETPDMSEIGALIVLGGEMNVDQTDEHPHLAETRDLTRQAIERELPVLGICLGAQVMARAMGAAVYPAPTREIGWPQVTATEAGARDPVLGVFAPASRVFQFHEDACELPTDAILLFEGEVCAVQGFRAGERAYASQFHLEVTEAEIAAWCDETPDLEGRWGATKASLLDEARLRLPEQHARARTAMERFLALVG